MSVTEGARVERLGALGPFFAVAVHEGVPAGGWTPLSVLADRPEVLRGRVDDVRAHLAAASGRSVDDVELRVAASVTHLGLAARVVSPLLALAALFGVRRPVRLGDLVWRDVPGGAFPLSLPRQVVDAAPASGDDDPRDWAAGLLHAPGGVLGELDQLMRPLLPSAAVRWGNLASAVNGAATLLVDSPVPAADPAPTAAPGPPQVIDCARTLLAHPALATAWTGEPGTAGFRRRSCCLIYRAALGAHASGPRVADRRSLCGDCVLRDP